MIGTDSWQHEHFERCWPLLEQALEVHAGTFRKADVWDAIATEKSQIWPTRDAIILTSIEVYPTGLKEVRGWLAAGDLTEIVAMEPEICAWAKSIGCKRVVLTGRRGWKRAFPDYGEMATFLSKDL